MRWMQWTRGLLAIVGGVVTSAVIVSAAYGLVVVSYFGWLDVTCGGLGWMVTCRSSDSVLLQAGFLVTAFVLISGAVLIWVLAIRGCYRWASPRLEPQCEVIPKGRTLGSIIVLVAVAAAILLLFGAILDTSSAERIRALEPPVIDLARCLDVPATVRSEIESTFMVGEIIMIGDEFYRLRLDRAVTGDWAAVEVSGGSEGDGYWIGSRFDVAHSSALPRIGNRFRPFNEARALAVYFQEGELGGAGGFYRYGDDYVDGYKLQISALPDMGTELGGEWRTWHPQYPTKDALATLAGCLGHTYPLADHVEWSDAPWLGGVEWAKLSGEPEWSGKASSSSASTSTKLGVVEVTGNTGTCTEGEEYSTCDNGTYTDPRVSGITFYTIECDFTEIGETTFGECSGSSTRANDGGTWIGTCEGTITWSTSNPDHVHVFDCIYWGTWDYENLRYIEHLEGIDYPWSITGRIEPIG